ncbi:MAG: rhodanese-like domain-containing protein [Hydrogenophilus sp.]|nr:rhodanese-like domain-containing protein [Hydrogenophilus sp.]
MDNFLAENWHWALLALLSGGWWLIETVRAATDKSRLTPMQATILINQQNAVPVDVRSDAEYRSGHIPGALHVPLERIPEDKALARHKHQPLILYCESGVRSASALAKLRKAGFVHLYQLVGGLAEWRKASLPLVTESKNR